MIRIAGEVESDARELILKLWWTRCLNDIPRQMDAVYRCELTRSLKQVRIGTSPYSHEFFQSACQGAKVLQGIPAAISLVHCRRSTTLQYGVNEHCNILRALGVLSSTTHVCDESAAGIRGSERTENTPCKGPT